MKKRCLHLPEFGKLLGQQKAGEIMVGADEQCKAKPRRQRLAAIGAFRQRHCHYRAGHMVLNSRLPV